MRVHVRLCNKFVRRVDISAVVGDVELAGPLTPFDLPADAANDTAETMALRAWLLQRFGDATERVILSCFHRCRTRSMFLRATSYGNDDKRIDYCVQLAPTVDEVAVAEDAAAAPGAAAAAAADTQPWLGLIETFWRATLRPGIGDGPEAVVVELVALVQPLAETPHRYRDVDVHTLPSGWRRMKAWIAAGALLPHVVSVSKATSAALPHRIVAVRNIVAKRCLLMTDDDDVMMVVQLQNSVEEL